MGGRGRAGGGAPKGRPDAGGGRADPEGESPQRKENGGRRAQKRFDGPARRFSEAGGFAGVRISSPTISERETSRGKFTYDRVGSESEIPRAREPTGRRPAAGTRPD